MVDEPQGEIYGGLVAGPAFRDITSFALNYLKIPPDPDSELQHAVVDPPVADREDVDDVAHAQPPRAARSPGSGS